MREPLAAPSSTILTCRNLSCRAPPARPSSQWLAKWEAWQIGFKLEDAVSKQAA